MTAQSVLTRAHVRAVALTRQRVETALKQIWATLPDYSDEGRNLFVARFTPVLIGGQSTIATLTNAYLTQLVSMHVDRAISPGGVTTATVTGAGVRNGLPPDVEWSRPFKTVWYELSQGADDTDATSAGLIRAQSMTAVDLQLAQTHAARETLSDLAPDNRIAGYARVTGADPCELCAIAATQRYHVEDLMPIHNRCSCTVEPIFGDDPGQVIERRSRADSLDDTDLDVREHGEIGPVLTVRGQEFRGPSDIPPSDEAETAD